MFESKVDFHIHTIYSDGTYSPVEIVKKYSKEEYDEIAITDHDGIGGVKEAKIAGEALNLKVHSGIEFSTSYRDNNVHLLGYDFDVDNLALNERLKEIRLARDRRNEKLIKTLNEMGYDIKAEEIYSDSKGGYIGKPNIARLMVKKGYFPDFDTVFKEIMEKEPISSMRKDKIDIFEAMKLINDAGGKPVLAHPKKNKFLGEPGSDEFYANLDNMLKELKKGGLKGMECFYPTHTTDDEFKLSSLCGKYHLHILKGSDFHGDK